MARRRYFRPQENFVRGPRVNDQIRISPVRLVDENDNMVGVVETGEAKRMAQEAGLDLVEVSANSTPPVVRIMDFGKWKYEQSKKDKASRAKSKGSELKEVRLGRSMKIDPHDIEIRLNQARKFLREGHKVQIVQQFHGREMIHRERGYQRMRDIAEKLSDVAKIETPPRMAGRRLSAIFAPDKAKIDQLKRRAAAEAEKDEAPDDASTAPSADAESPDRRSTAASPEKTGVDAAAEEARDGTRDSRAEAAPEPQPTVTEK